MRRIRIAFRLCLFAFLGLLFSYVLPQKDIVQVTDTDTQLTSFGSVNQWFYSQPDSGTGPDQTRDVRFIFTDKKKTALFGLIPRDATGASVYRNEDTGWLWPPYFKFDSQDLQAEAASAARRSGDTENGNWSVITHYGWRIPFLSIYPNAVAIEPATGPDQRIIPWFNIIFFILLTIAYFFVRAMWMQLRERSIDPLVETAEDRIDELNAGVAKRRGRLRNWLGGSGSNDKTP